MPDPDPPKPITPIPAPDDADRIVLFGGTFDPPTLAHAPSAHAARDRAAGSDAILIFVPAARSPFKPDAPTADQHRVEMLRLVAENLPNAEVWTDEIARAEAGQPSYWVDTLRRAEATRPNTAFSFLIGTDQAASFHKWREARTILELARPIVFPRDPIESRDQLRTALDATNAWNRAEIERWLAAMLELPTLPGSATDARAALANPGTPAARLADLLDPAVLDYISAHDLYQSADGG